MYAQIKSVDADRSSSSGKAPWIASNAFELSLGKTELSLDKTEHVIQLTARDLDLRGTGERGGHSRMVRRELSLTLTPQDLEKIVEFAIVHQLIELRVGVNKRSSRGGRKRTEV